MLYRLFPVVALLGLALAGWSALISPQESGNGARSELQRISLSSASDLEFVP